MQLPGHRNHDPGHHQHHRGANRRTQVRLHTGNAGLAEDRRQSREESRSQGVQQPTAAGSDGPRKLADVVSIEHRIRAHSDEPYAEHTDHADALPQEQ